MRKHGTKRIWLIYQAPYYRPEESRIIGARWTKKAATKFASSFVEHFRWSAAQGLFYNDELRLYRKLGEQEVTDD